MKNNDITAAAQQFFLYKDSAGRVQINALLHDETLWLTQKAIAELFQVERSVITKHIGNIYKESELSEKSVCANFAHTATDGKSYNTAFYNLDMIIAVGYRVNSKQATAFRIWATEVLREYIIKGFVIDDERLKKANKFGADYFREMLDRIKDIRISERRFYQQLKDIYALSADYNQDYRETLEFFARVQNKVHYAITGYTAPEIIHARSDHQKNNMGLTSWEGSPNRRITSTDVTVAKNYLQQDELDDLRYIVIAFLDYAEHEAKSKRLIFMKDWEGELNRILEFNRKAILAGKGTITREKAEQKALAEYAKYRERIRPLEQQEWQQEFLLDIKELEKMEAELSNPSMGK
ncbi:MAG: virulence RhuM family protein [Spirochaetes bacterium]|nr:virulence RhuM family protein [Spirochaetota bacterium]